MQRSTQKRGKLRVRDASSQQIRTPAQSIERTADLMGRFGEIVGTAVGERAFGEAPHAFIGIQLWRVAWEPGHTQPWVVSAEELERIAVMDLRIVEQQHDRPTQVAKQLTEELADPHLIEVVLVESKVQPQPLAARTHRDGRDHRNLVPARAMAMQRCLPARGPGLDDGRDQEEARFVSKDDVGIQPCGVFFILRHCSRFQRSIALALRSSVRRSGF